MSLMRPIKQGLARVLGGGGGDYSVTVPVMDGPLKPNDVIEATGRIAHIPGGANIAEIDGTLVASPDALTVSRSGPHRVARMTPTSPPSRSRIGAPSPWVSPAGAS